MTDVDAPPERRESPAVPRPALARRPVAAVAAGVTLLLLATANGYGYHRDELYFRMLGERPAWGYVDQPPLSPLLARLGIAVFGDTVWAVRVPGALLLGVSAVLAALIAREVGGRAVAQTIAALGLATTFPLISAHISLTANPDLCGWLLVLLFAVRALLHGRHRSWLWLGLVVGLCLYNKHLVLLLLICLAVGLALVGPRRTLVSGWVWAGLGVAVLVGLPNLLYQVTHGFPQLDMAGALAENNGADVRVELLPFQLILLGPPLVPIWVAGIVALLRDPRLRPIRALAVAYPIMLVTVWIVGGQNYYPIGLLVALFAVGAVPTERWLAGRRGRQALVTAAVVVNAVVSAVVALPLVPIGQLAATPVPAVNETAGDQVGWPRYVRQVADVYAGLPSADQARTVLLTSNYGEAGALERYGPDHRLPPVYSGQNELFHRGPPPATAEVVIFVYQGRRPERFGAFGSCVLAGRLDNGYGVDNEEQGTGIYVCRDPRGSWDELWPRFQHFD